MEFHIDEYSPMVILYQHKRTILSLGNCKKASRVDVKGSSTCRGGKIQDAGNLGMGGHFVEIKTHCCNSLKNEQGIFACFQILAAAAHKKTVLEAEAVADAQALKVLFRSE